jgi:threonine aldolase
MRTIDLRSDTITRPTPSMRRAMAEAEVGDDVFGEDPTVNRLEKTAAERLGKQAALFVASGTMGNLASVLSHCGRGDEAILGDLSHMHLFEQGGMAALGGVHPRTVRNEPDGTMNLDAVEAAVRPDDIQPSQDAPHSGGEHSQPMPRQPAQPGLHAGPQGTCRPASA